MSCRSPVGSVPETPVGHVVLVGLPGSGKSALGAELAIRLTRPFLDFDVEIARRLGTSVASIFATRGEAYFRDQERLLTAEVAEHDPMVLAPGGGWITNPDLVARLGPSARIILLRVSPEVALRRMGASVSERPLLANGDPLSILRSLAMTREQAYARANAVLDTEILAPQQLVEQLALLASPQGVG